MIGERGSKPQSVAHSLYKSANKQTKYRKLKKERSTELRSGRNVNLWKEVLKFEKKWPRRQRRQHQSQGPLLRWHLAQPWISLTIRRSFWPIAKPNSKTGTLTRTRTFSSSSPPLPFPRPLSTPGLPIAAGTTIGDGVEIRGTRVTGTGHGADTEIDEIITTGTGVMTGVTIEDNMNSFVTPEWNKEWD